MTKVNIPIKINIIGTVKSPDDIPVFHALRTDSDGNLTLDISFEDELYDCKVNKDVDVVEQDAGVK